MSHEYEPDFINRLPEPVLLELFGHYIGMQLRMRVEMELLGCPVIGLDFADDNFWLEFIFEDWDTLETFVSIADSGVDWETEGQRDNAYQPGIVLFMPRTDCHVVFMALKQLAADVPEVKRATVIAKYEQRRNGQHYEKWGDYVPKFQGVL